MFTVKLLDHHPYVIYCKAKHSQPFLLSFSDLFQLFRCPFSSVNPPSFSWSLCIASSSHRNLPSQYPLSSFIPLRTLISLLRAWRCSQVSCVAVLLGFTQVTMLWSTASMPSVCFSPRIYRSNPSAVGAATAIQAALPSEEPDAGWRLKLRQPPVCINVLTPLWMDSVLLPGKPYGSSSRLKK